LRCIYTIFHLNLAFSSIEEEDRPAVMQRCYWALLKLLKKYNFPVGIELTGYTLELINLIDPEWIVALKDLLAEGRCELIGSGYSQIIGPLVPAEVNYWNQRNGLKIYENLLGELPEIALVNEMAYSRGVVEHYIDAGYKSLVMEWNNPYKYNNHWPKEYKYFPQIVTDTKKRKIALLWADSIAFQKFQRYVHCEMDLPEYMEYLNKHRSEEDRYFPLYGNDIEVFDFRPGRFETEALLPQEGIEWGRIACLVEELNACEDVRLILPSQALLGVGNKSGGNLLTLESPEQPIPVKKQEKYNINRWALTGRDDFGINSRCFALYEKISGTASSDLWKELCYLWSSDFRTHITQKRWSIYMLRLKQFENEIFGDVSPEIRPERKEIVQLPYCKHDLIIEREGRYWSLRNSVANLTLNEHKGLTIDRAEFDGTGVLFGILAHGYYDDISLGADFYSGHTVIEHPGQRKFTDLVKVEPKVSIENNFITISCGFEDESLVYHKGIILDNKTIQLNKKFNITKREQSSINPFFFTFNPEAWDHNTLYFATHNGGTDIEVFPLKESSNIEHRSMVSTLISSRHALGATKGIVIIGDADKELIFEHDVALGAMIPTIVYRLTGGDMYFFRLQYSVQELDETFRVSDSPVVIQLKLKIHQRIK
jgi:hypothetical protein